MEKSLSLGPECLSSISGSASSSCMTGSGLLSGSQFPSCERRLAGGRAQYGFQDAEKGKQNSLKTSFRPASEIRAEKLEGSCALWPVDMGSGQEGDG